MIRIHSLNGEFNFPKVIEYKWIDDILFVTDEEGELWSFPKNTILNFEVKYWDAVHPLVIKRRREKRLEGLNPQR